jgi:hypothetical protein
VFVLLIVTLLMASAFLSSCGAEKKPAGASPSQGSGEPAQPPAGEAPDESEKTAAPGTSPSGGEAEGNGGSGPEDPSGDGGANDEGLAWFEGKLVKPEGALPGNASFLFAADGGDILTVNGDFAVIDKDGKPLDKSALKAGARIRVEYGVVLDSYPGQIAPRTVQVMSEGDDMVGFYLTILDKIWNEDAALNPKQDGMLAFDLEKVSNLTDSEKAALIWCAGTRYGVWSIASTFEKLKEEGYIDEKALEFKDKNGMLVAFSTSKVQEGSFKFKVSKWVSGMGADWYDDCTATKTGGVWSFELGGFAVS